MRDAFAVLFFVSVGMLFDPKAVIDAPWLAAATFAIIVAGKPLASFLLMLALGQPLRTAASVALSLGQIGEFSFILAGMGTSLGLLPQRATSVLVAAAIVSIAVSPVLHRLTDPIASLARRRPARPALPDRGPQDLAPAEPGPSPRFRAVVVGYGPVGRTLVRLLAENGVDSTVIEMNLETVRRLRDEGVPVVYGDASHRETLQAAGVERAASLILGASGLRAPQEIIRMARELNPDLRVLVRSAYLHERAALLAAGADLVFSGEGEVALAMTESVLQALGATPEQIDRERERLRQDFHQVGGERVRK
jgi:monovalent cation:H+ antiporter-2, CPA2 family